jgi:hypothetical protein
MDISDDMHGSREADTIESALWWPPSTNGDGCGKTSGDDDKETCGQSFENTVLYTLYERDGRGCSLHGSHMR